MSVGLTRDCIRHVTRSGDGLGPKVIEWMLKRDEPFTTSELIGTANPATKPTPDC